MKLIKVSVGLTSINSNPNQLHNTIHTTLQHIDDGQYGHPFTINLTSCFHLDLHMILKLLLYFKFYIDIIIVQRYSSRKVYSTKDIIHNLLLHLAYIHVI